MKKLLYILMVSTAVFFPLKAKADMEIVQKVITKIEVVEDKSSVFLQKYAAAKEEIQSIREGPNKLRGNFGGVVKDFASRLGIKKKLPSAVNQEFSNVNDQATTEDDFKENVLLQVGKGNETAASQEFDRVMKLITAENVAILYAKAFTTRTNLYKEEIPELDRTNTQEIIRATTAMEDSITRRYNSIWDLDAVYLEFYASDISREFNGGEAEDTLADKGGSK